VTAAAQRNKGGRPRDDDTTELYEVCWFLYVVKDLSAPIAMNKCNSIFGPDAIPNADDSRVRRYTAIHAKRTGTPRKGDRAAIANWINENPHDFTRLERRCTQTVPPPANAETPETG
jgi:hypothetical protein